MNYVSLLFLVRKQVLRKAVGYILPLTDPNHRLTHTKLGGFPILDVSF